MKQDSIQRLLEKYREGTLSPAELTELNRLTHKDEVVKAASHRAGRIIMRRRVAWTSMAVVALLVTGVGVRIVMPSGEEPVLVAEQRVPMEVQPQQEESEVTEAIAAKVEQILPEVPKVVRAHKPTPRRGKPSSAMDVAVSKPVVVCNNQCEADSVINDIKRFLSV